MQLGLRTDLKVAVAVSAFDQVTLKLSKSTTSPKSCNVRSFSLRVSQYHRSPFRHVIRQYFNVLAARQIFHHVRTPHILRRNISSSF